MPPKVTVLMSCFNSNPQLFKASVESVLNQTFKDFEFVIVIDDRSTYPSEDDIIKEFSDTRIKILHIPSSGLGEALTYGIKNSSGEYIARTDDDDLMVYNRLETQVQYLSSHPEVSCVGSQRYSYTGGRYMKHRKFPLTHNKIVESMLSLKWAMAHTALMYRRESIEKAGYYRIKGCGEDVDLILQLSLVGKLANIDEYLIYYYLGMKSLSAKNNVNQLNGHLFALQSIKDNNNYPMYAKIIDKSIENIKFRLNDTKSKMAWKKWILLKLIRLFGNKLNFGIKTENYVDKSN